MNALRLMATSLLMVGVGGSGRRHARAGAHGLDAQSRSHDRGVVPGQEPADPLVAGCGLSSSYAETKGGVSQLWRTDSSSAAATWDGVSPRSGALRTTASS